MNKVLSLFIGPSTNVQRVVDFLALEHRLLCHFVTYMTCVEDPIGVYSMQFTEPRTIPVCDGGCLN